MSYPDENFRKSSPPKPFGSLKFVSAGEKILETVEFENPEHGDSYYCIIDDASQVLLATQWVDLTPSDADDGDTFIIPKGEGTI